MAQGPKNIVPPEKAPDQPFCRKCGKKLPKAHSSSPQPNICPECAQRHDRSRPQEKVHSQNVVSYQSSGVVDAQNQYICHRPQCGGSVDPESGKCAKCGQLHGTGIQLQQQATTAGVAAGNAGPTVTSPPSLATPQNTAGQQVSMVADTWQQYICHRPQCGGSVDPESGKCAKCGQLHGTGIQLQQQATGAATDATNAMPQATAQTLGGLSPEERIRPAPSGQSIPPPRSPLLGEIEHDKPNGWRIPSLPRWLRIGVVAILGISLLGFLGFATYQFAMSTGLVSAAKEVAGRFGSPQLTLQPSADSRPLEIENVLASPITGTGAVITWETDEPATGQVEYGTTEAYGSNTLLNEELTTSHSASLSGLQPNTTYHFSVISTDESGNRVTSDTDQLTTLPPADTTPPAISGVDIPKTTDLSASITWETGEDATSQVEYWTTDSDHEITQLDDDLKTSHSVRLNELEPGTNYYFKAKSKDDSGNEASSHRDAFYTLPALRVGHEVGNRAPIFALPEYEDNDNPESPNDGEMVDLSNLLGKKKLLIDFWSTRCSACIAQFPLILEIYCSDKCKQNEDNAEIAVFAVCIDGERTDRIKSLNDKYRDKFVPFNFPILLDEEGAATVDEYNIWRIPKTVFIDSHGIIREIKIGQFDSQEEIESILESL